MIFLFTAIIIIQLGIIVWLLIKRENNGTKTETVSLNNSAQVAAFYNQTTHKFLEVYGEIIQAFRTNDVSVYLDYTIQNAELKDGQKILDAGCGVGGPASYFASTLNVEIEGITISSVQVEKSKEIIATKKLRGKVNIKQGEIISVSDNSNYQIRFDRIDYKAGQNFLAREGIFSILENGRELYRIKPQLRYYPVSDQTTNEAAIRHGIFGDLYLAIGNKDENNFYALRIYYKPFIYLIWLGCFIMSFAAMLKIAQVFIGKKNEASS